MTLSYRSLHDEIALAEDVDGRGQLLQVLAAASALNHHAVQVVDVNLGVLENQVAESIYH